MEYLHADFDVPNNGFGENGFIVSGNDFCVTALLPSLFSPSLFFCLCVNAYMELPGILRHDTFPQKIFTAVYESIDQILIH